MLVVVRKDSNPAVSSPMKKTVTLKALKNKDRLSIETAIEVLSPEVQRAMLTDDVVTTIVPEIYTFWRQNRPGILTCPVDAAVHLPTGAIFFSNQFTHQIMMSDFHCPAMLSSIAGENSSGLRDGRKSLFQNPSGLYANLIFVCDSGNASIRIIDISRLVSRKKNDSPFYEASESEDQGDSIPIARKYTITCSLSLISTNSLQLQRPSLICTGRKILQDYPDFYAGDTTQGIVFKLTNVTINSSPVQGNSKTTKTVPRTKQRREHSTSFLNLLSRKTFRR